MKKQQPIMERYETPQVEIIEVEVEKGFAGSTLDITGGMGETDPMGGNGNITGGGYN